MSITPLTKGNTSLVLPAERAAQVLRRLRGRIAGQRFLLERDANEVMAIAAGVLERELPKAYLRAFARFGAGTCGTHILIEGFKPDEYPPTPVRGYCDDSQVALGDALLLGVYRLMGIEPVAYAFENDGRLFRNVVPNPDASGVASSHGFNAALGWHHDNPCGRFESAEYQPFERSPIPHYLGFWCLRNQDAFGEPVPTELLPIEEALRRMSAGGIMNLRRPEFGIKPPQSNECPPLEKVPLMVGNFLRFNALGGQVYGLTERANAAIEELQQRLAASVDNVVQVKLVPGSLLIFDNYRVAHRRRVFDPGKDWDNSRWLRRVFGCQSLSEGLLVDRYHWPHLWR